ncbi:N-acetyltransferase [Methanohalophilus portucalensis FDF-1]|uniref:N-acetyltransferase n=1 Tax=Methanohalophilus portucalensis FDF-1 TaxID=523843 RepID=A0A3M9LDB1_9EURY|nr:N-acetyltransferase [Methanohalophilus portucalensis FDF-1]
MLPKHWNRGFATEAIQIFLHHACRKLDCKQFIAFSHEDNIASRKVAIKIGMKNEGPTNVKGVDHKPLRYTLNNCEN